MHGWIFLVHVFHILNTPSLVFVYHWPKMDKLLYWFIPPKIIVFWPVYLGWCNMAGGACWVILTSSHSSLLLKKISFVFSVALHRSIYVFSSFESVTHLVFFPPWSQYSKVFSAARDKYENHCLCLVKVKMFLHLCKTFLMENVFILQKLTIYYNSWIIVNIFWKKKLSFVLNNRPTCLHNFHPDSSKQRPWTRK